MAAEDDELRMVEEEARREWAEAGYFAGAFTMDAYNEQFLSKEMGNQEKEWRLNDITMQSNLGEKRAIIEAEADRRLTREKVQKAVVGFAQDRAVDALNAGLEVSSYFEPGFMRRARQRRRHLGRIAQAEADADRVVMERKETQTRRKQWRRLEVQAKKQRDGRVADMGPTALIAHDVEGAAREERRAAEAQQFRDRSLAILEQKNNEAELKREVVVVEKEKQAVELRNWRAGYWAEHSEDAAEEAQVMIQETKTERARKERELVAFDDAELAERDMQRTHDQVSGPSVSFDPSGLGVFGVPWEQGHEASSAANRRSGADDAEVSIFSAPAQTGYEEEVLELHAIQAEEGRQGDLWRSLNAEVKAVDSEMAGLGLLRHRVNQEERQLRQDVALLEQTTFGPPRRDPAPHQIEANHERKKRLKQLQERLQQVDKRCEFLRDSKASASSQSIDVAKSLAVARERREAKEAALNEVNNGLGELPMILGQSIGKTLAEGNSSANKTSQGGGAGGRPNEEYDLVRHELVFRELEEQVKKAQRVHTGSLKAATEQWGAEQRKINEESTYQMTLNKLASIGERVKVARDQDQRLDVTGAVNLFHVKNAKLKTVVEACDGSVEWWDNRNSKRVTVAGGSGDGEEKSQQSGGHRRASSVNSVGEQSLSSQPSSSQLQLERVVQWPSNDMAAHEFFKNDDDGQGGNETLKADDLPNAKSKEEEEGAPTSRSVEGRGGGGEGEKEPGGGGVPVSEEGGRVSGDGGDESVASSKVAKRQRKKKVENAAAAATTEGETAEVFSLPGDIADGDPMWQGATLRGDCLNGSLSGEFLLPRFDYFVVHIPISKTKPLDVKQGDANETLTVRMGPDSKKLVKVAQVRNEPDPVTGAYRHTVSYRIRGDKFAFRFEWECSTMDLMLRRRLTLEKGWFELYRMEDLELVQPSKGAEDQTVRCVSSLVKKMRMDTSTHDVQGITDLIRAQGSEDKGWDSDWLHPEYPQRFKHRRDFIKLIKHELKAKAKTRGRERAREEAEVAEAIAREEGEALLLAEGKDTTKAAVIDDGGDDNVSALTLAVADGAALAKDEAGDDKGAAAKRMARLEKSKIAFRERKREVFSSEVDAANALPGKRIEVLVGAKWQRSMISECRIEWVQDGLVPRPVHKIIPVDESERKNGIPTWEDLTKRRWYERLAVANAEVDEGAAARWKENERRRSAIQEEERLEQANEQSKLETRERYVEGLLDDEEERRRQAMAVATVKFERLSKKMSKTVLAREAIRSKTERIVGDHRIGNGTASGLPELISKGDARRQALAEWVTHHASEEMLPVEGEWDARKKSLEEFIVEQRETWAEADLTNAERKKRIERKRQNELAAIRTQKTKDLRLRMTVPNFESLVAHAKAFSCEHLRCRSWGDMYGKGVRCVACGQEISRTHENVKQQAGIGSGDNSTLIEQVDRHRRNEASYRFRTQAELALVEKERLRLEKDRREVECVDPLFYDFVDPEFIYELDRRHRIELKDRNVVRQGVQWQEVEMSKAREEIREEIEAMTDPVKRAVREEEVKQWYDEQSPPTFRKSDLKHRAQFRHTLQTHGRIHNFRMRIGELEQALASLTNQTKQCVEVLEFLHRTSFALERDLNAIEMDLSAVTMVLRIDRAAAVQLRDAKAIEALAAEDLRDKEMAVVGTSEDAAASEAKALSLSRTVTEVIRRRVVFERRVQGLFKRTDTVRRRANAMLPGRSDAAREVHSMHYRQFGVVVPTPYGYGKVLLYREDDGMLLCQLSFGKPRARLYVPLAVPMRLEKAKEDAERLCMERDEEHVRGFYAWEKEFRRSEYALMNFEERTLRDHFRRADEAAAEDRAIAFATAQGVANAKAFLQLPAGRAVVESRGRKLLNEKKADVERSIKAWRGMGTIPKRMKKREEREFLADQVEPETSTFLEEQRVLAELESKGQVSARHKRHLEEETVSFVYDEMVAVVLKELCGDALGEDVDAKRRVEEETGLYFRDPAHMTFSVYATLGRWWGDEKLLLRSNLERWGAASVQDRLKVASDSERAAARKLLLAKNVKKMAESERQQFECESMGLAEKEVRVVYRFELKKCLAERRAMQAEEAAMRMHEHERKIALAAQANNKYALKGAGSEGRGGQGNDGEEDGMSSKELRRLQVKMGGVDKQRLKRERDAMLEEDKASLSMRVEEQKQIQLAILKAQMALMGAPGGDDEDEEDDAEDEGVAGGGVDPDQRAKLKKEKADARRRAKEGRLQAEEDAKAHFEMVKREAFVKHAKVELAWMELEEEARRGEAELDKTTKELRRINLISQIKGQEELRAKAFARRQRHLADTHTGELGKALKWHTACAQQVDKCRRTRQRVYRDTLFMDTTAIAGTSGFYFQRCTSVQLHDILTRLYFQKLLLTITNRAELLATERKLLELSQSMSHANRQLRIKKAGVTELWSDLRRSELERLKRSELGVKMFGKWQRSILGTAFKGWVQFWLWNQGVRSAFELDYAVIKHSLDLKRVRPALREHNERKANTVTEEYTKNTQAGGPKHPNLIKPLPKKPTVPKTMLQRHIARPVKCRHCASFYLEAQNHSLACAFHPGEYKAACPASCPGLTPKCSAHRSKRWSCCDVRELGKFGSTGCRQRFHLPVDQDPVYLDAVEAKTGTLGKAMAEADKKLEVINRDDVRDVARKTKLNQIKEIAVLVDSEREVVKRADQYGFSDVLLTSFTEQVRAEQSASKEKERTRAEIARMGAELATRAP